MKLYKIKNISPTGAKVLLFLMLAVTLGFSMVCRSGGDGDKGDGMKPGDNMVDADADAEADAEAVKRAKDGLMIGYAEGDSAESVTQDVSLPTAGENGVIIAWESGNRAVITVPPPPDSATHITGTVTRPNDMDTEVTLTATLTKNTARDTIRFTLTVVISEDSIAVQRAKSALMIGYAAGDSAESVTQDIMLPATGENGVSVSWASSDAASISTTGMVTRPSAADTEVTLTATLTKNTARDERVFTLTVTLPCGTTNELLTKLQAMPPSLGSCSAAGIRGADMPALVSAGVTSTQFLAVWSADGDIGFTPVQLKEADVTVTEMKSHGLTIAQVQTGGFSIADLRSGGFADHLVFNEACNTPQTRGTAPNPTITLTTTTLSATDTQVVLEGKANAGGVWIISENSAGFTFGLDTLRSTKMLGNATVEYVRDEGTKVVITLSIPFADVFSNPTVGFSDQNITTNIQLCPGR